MLTYNDSINRIWLRAVVMAIGSALLLFGPVQAMGFVTTYPLSNDDRGLFSMHNTKLRNSMRSYCKFLSRA